MRLNTQKLREEKNTIIISTEESLKDVEPMQWTTKKPQEKISIDSLYNKCELLYDYCTKSYKYNHFIIDEVNEEWVKELKKAMDEEDKKRAVMYYMKIDRQIDEIRNEYCYNILPYKASFRGIAKDMYRELKESWLLYLDDFDYIGYVLRFISTSEYRVIKDFLKRRSDTMFLQKDIPLDPDKFYCGYIPLEAFMDYSIAMLKLYKNYIQ